MTAGKAVCFAVCSKPADGDKSVGVNLEAPDGRKQMHGSGWIKAVG